METTNEAREAYLLIDGEWVAGETTEPVLDKFTGAEIARFHVASKEQVGQATRGVAAAAATPLDPYVRFRVLSQASRLLTERAEEFIETLVAEGGFPGADSKREVDRAIQTLLLCAEEAKRIHGEVVPVDGDPGGGDGRLAWTVRRPLGVVCAITPFNAPLNTVLHKVGPALAAGNGVVLKPSGYTPLIATLMGRLLLDAGLPAGLLAIVHGPGPTVGRWLTEDEVPAFYAFTGSTAVGLDIRRTVGLRKTQLELGSIASVIICADADLTTAVSKCVTASFRKAGQVCTSVQRLYVAREVYDDVVGALADAVGGLRAGDPRDPAVAVGPLISRGEAERVGAWVAQAVEAGATIVVGGGRTGSVHAPTVLVDVPAQVPLHCEEIFGPVLTVLPFDDLSDAIDSANDTPYGLAAGIFTASIGNALDAATQLRMGSVHINETSNARMDLMPYTGVKASGQGREGPRYAIEEMSEEKLITMRR